MRAASVCGHAVVSAADGKGLHYLTLSLTNDTRTLYLLGTHGQLTYPSNARGEILPRQANITFHLA